MDPEQLPVTSRAMGHTQEVQRRFYIRDDAVKDAATSSRVIERAILGKYEFL